MIILASKSPRRIEMLRRMGIEFTAVSSNADESHPENCNPSELVSVLSKRKAEAVKCGENDIIISADTVVSYNGKILEKPKSRGEAVEMLNILSGKCHQVYTGFTVKSKDKTVVDFSVTDVRFRQLNREEIESYVDTGEPMDKAGSYGIQELGGMFVEGIEGDYNTVVGLPLCKLLVILRDEFGFDVMKKRKQ